jgi:hypothetical protein
MYWNDKLTSTVAEFDAEYVKKGMKEYVERAARRRNEEFDKKLAEKYPKYIESYKNKKSIRFINFCLRWFAWGKLRGFQFEPMTEEDYAEYHPDMRDARFSKIHRGSKWSDRASEIYHMADKSSGKIFLDVQDASLLQ